MQNYFQNEPKFNGVYSRTNLLKIKDEAYVTNLDECKLIGNHWIAFYVNGDNVTYFDSFGVERSPKGIKKFIDNKILITNIYGIQGNDSILCGYFCINFIESMLKDKSLLVYTIYFLLTNMKKKKHDKIILKYFQ